MTSASARFDIASGSGLDRLELALPWDPRAVGLHRRAILRLDPFEPVRPPAALVLLGAVDERLERVAWLIVGPILILLRGGRVDHARDMPRAGEDEPFRTLEVVHDLPHALRRRDMIFAPGLHIGRRLHRTHVDRSAGDRDPALLG